MTGFADQLLDVEEAAYAWNENPGREEGEALIAAALALPFRAVREDLQALRGALVWAEGYLDGLDDNGARVVLRKVRAVLCPDPAGGDDK